MTTIHSVDYSFASFLISCSSSHPASRRDQASGWANLSERHPKTLRDCHSLFIILDSNPGTWPKAVSDPVFSESARDRSISWRDFVWGRQFCLTCLCLRRECLSDLAGVGQNSECFHFAISNQGRASCISSAWSLDIFSSGMLLDPSK